MSREEATRRLSEAIEAFGAEHAPELVAEARTAAMAKARAMLTDGIAESLLANSAPLLRSEGSRHERASTPPQGPSARTEREPVGRRSQPTAPRTRPAQQPRRSADAADQPAAGGLGQYVYGVTLAPADIPAELVGVDPGFPVTSITERDLAAIVSAVPLDEFGEERLRENLNDVSWLEGRARAHEDVLEASLRRGTVVPMRLCTIYSGEDQVREILRSERDVLLDALTRLEGKAEWGVKMVAEPGALERAVAEETTGSGDDHGASPGAAYLDRKRRQAQSREEELRLADDWSEEVHEQLAAAACEALLNPLQRSDVSGYEGDMLLNGVYLVEDRRLEEFRDLVGRLDVEYGPGGVTLHLTGPWPAYNFVKSSIEAAR